MQRLTRKRMASALREVLHRTIETLRQIQSSNTKTMHVKRQSTQPNLVNCRGSLVQIAGVSKL
jgi:hypothetical protein